MPDENMIEVWTEVGRGELATSPRVTVGLGTCGRAAGAQTVHDALAEEFPVDGSDGVRFDAVGCRGACWAEPLVEVQMGDGRSYAFPNVTAAQARIIADQVRSGRLNARRCAGCFPVMEDVASAECDAGACEADLLIPDAEDLFAHQSRFVMASCGFIDPFSVEQYAAMGGFSALDYGLSRDPEAVLAAVEASGLRGRGGAGFPTGRKWSAVREAAVKRGAKPMVIVNADEGDPGAYMDRTLLESVPFQVIEGALLAAYAVGATQVYVFVRSEYPQACRTLEAALARARAYGIVGVNVLGSGWAADVAVIESAGSFVCGEETAMIAAIEGRVPRPHPKPPYPSDKGLWGRPTLINNVETLANVPLVVRDGGAALRAIGRPDCPGTKVLSLPGAVARVGIAEVEMGTSIGEVLREVGRAKAVKAVQLGGPSGAFIAPKDFGLALDFASLDERGSIMGSGGLLVVGEADCIVDLTRYLVRFCAEESCGRCPSCRDGLATCALLLDRLVEGEGSEADIEELSRLACEIEQRSLCGLGKGAARPLASALDLFPEEFAAHARGTCPSAVCRALVHLVIRRDRCHGERCCLGSCPGNAVKGRFGKPGTIDFELCRKCFTCLDVCPYKAVEVHPL